MPNDISNLSDEEKKIKDSWNRVVFLIKRDLANVWTDKARQYFTDLEHETQRVAFIFKRLHSHYKSNTKDQYTGYYYEMLNLRQFIKDVRKIHSRKEWVSRIHAELQIIIKDIETEIDNGRKYIRQKTPSALNQITNSISRYLKTVKEPRYYQPVPIYYSLSENEVEIHPNLIERHQSFVNLVQNARDLWNARFYYKIGNAEYLISYPQEINESERLWTFILVRISGSKKFYFNIYYYSGTHQVWRLAYAQYGVLAKGYPESAVNAPNELQVILSRTDFINKHRLLNARVHPKQFVPISKTTEPLSHDYSYFEEFQKFRKQIKTVKINLDKAAVRELEGFRQWKYCKPENVRWQNDKFNPNYGKVLVEFESSGVYRGAHSQTIYGKVIPSINRRIEYLFLYDQYGRIWIGNIDIPSSPITKYGVRKHTILVPRELDTPVNCYTDELPVEYVKDRKNIWSDASPYLDKIPIIQQFRINFRIEKKY